jgi:hypothetical protein
MFLRNKQFPFAVMIRIIDTLAALSKKGRMEFADILMLLKLWRKKISK